MGIYQKEFEKFGFVPLNHAEPNYFDVGMTNIFDDKGNRIPGHMAVKRMDTYDTLAVHSDAYRPVLDKDVFEAFEVGLANNFDTTGMGVMYDRTHNGARMFVQYVLPKYTIDINGAQVSLRFLMWNSHDGSRATSGRAGHFNWVCANEAVTGKTVDAFEIKHIGKRGVGTEGALEASRAKVLPKIAGLIASAKEASEELRRMQSWAHIKLADSMVDAALKAFPGATDTLHNMLLADYTRAKSQTGPNGGDTAWSLYNVLTAWATHTKGKSDKNSTNAKVERQERVAKFMATREWKDLTDTRVHGMPLLSSVG